MKNILTKLFLIPICICACACSSLNNNKEESKQECSCPTTSRYSSRELNSGSIQVYVYTSYGSYAYYRELQTYEAPCVITYSNSEFIIDKDNKAYHYSIPMFQYSFVLE